MRLKELREDKNLTQNEVALAIKTSQTNIGRWEKGINEPAAGYLILLADLFECTIDYLLGRSDDFGNIAIKEKRSSGIKPEEQELLDNFRSLPKTEQTQAFEYVQYLADKRGRKKA